MKNFFLSFLSFQEVIKFGNFTTKSGRETPYFLDFGSIVESDCLFQLAFFYAQKIIEISREKSEKKSISNLDIIFGSAYKGIPLSIAISSLLHSNLEVNLQNQKVKLENNLENNHLNTTIQKTNLFPKVHFAFNRKEKKDHGEKGILIGKKITNRDTIVVVDDVLTSGKSIIESIEILQNNGGKKISFVIVGVDRQEKSIEDDSLSAKQMIEKKYNIPVFAISNLSEILTVFKESFDNLSQEKLSNYLQKNCILK